MMCAYPTCLNETNGLFALICDTHRVERKAECEEQRRNPKYQPSNPACAYGYHAGVLTCLCRGQRWPGGECKPCHECHFCSDVHEAA